MAHSQGDLRSNVSGATKRLPWDTKEVALAPSSVLVVRPGAPSSLLAPFVAMPFAVC